MMWFWLWLTGAAVAQQACPTPMSRIQLGAGIGRVEEALRDDDLQDARVRLQEIRDRLPCLDVVIEPSLFARVAQQMAIVHYVDEDEEQALRWGLASEAADPSLGWDDASHPPDHPLRVALDQAGARQPLAAQGKHFVAPKGGGVFLNGTFAAVPAAPADLPTLVQVFDRDQILQRAFWQEGHTFPADLLADGDAPLRPPLWVDRPSTTAPSVAPGRTGPARQPIPWIPVVATASLAIGSGATLGLAWQAAGSMPDQTTGEALTRARSRANAYTLASGVTLAGAVSVGTAAVLTRRF